MKKLIFFLVLCFSLPFLVNGQTSNRKICGTYRKPPTTNPNPVSHTGGISNSTPNQFFDRFGNTYLENELLVTQSSADSKCTAGFFELTFIQATAPANFSNAEITIICKAFTDLSAKIKSVGKPRIRITKTQADGNTLAVGSSYYHRIPNCTNVGNSEVWESVNLDKTSTYGSQLYEGFVDFNINITTTVENIPKVGPILWHTNIDDKIPTPSDKFDMYTVALHEAMHTLGIASMIKDDGSAYNGIYSLWDKYLFDNKSKKSVLIDANNPNCCGELVKNPVPLNILAPCADTDLRLSQNGSTKINTVLVGDFSNTHSHVCDDELVMSPGIPAGKKRKFMTNPEWDLLCKIGYEIINNTPNCKNNCVVYAKDDFFKLSDPNLTLYTIKEQDIIANDYISSVSNYTIVNSYYSATSKEFNFPLHQGINEFTYTLKGCDGICTQATIIIIIPYTLPVCPNNTCDDCNLVCHGDLETLDNSNADNFTFFKVHKYNLDVNSIELYQDNSDNHLFGGFFIPSQILQSSTAIPHKGWEFFCQKNWAPFNLTYSPPSPAPTYLITAPPNTPKSKFIHLNTENYYSADNNYNEAIYFELKEPLIVGSPYFINFDKFSGCKNKLNFAFSNVRPCTRPTTIFEALKGTGATTVNCGDGTDFPVPQQIVKMDYDGNLSKWEFISNEKTPFIANVAAKYVIIYQEPNEASSIFLDNIFIAPKRKVPVDVTSTITEPCSINIKGAQIEVKYKICIPSTVTIPATITITPSIVNSIPGLTINTSGSFQKGIEIITLPSNGSNCIEKTLVIDIDPALFSGKASILLDFISNDICYKCSHTTKYISGTNVNSLTGLFSKTSFAQANPKGYTGQNGNLAISGVLTIDQDYSFSSTNFTAEAGAKIEIAEGVKVIFDNCQFYTCGDQMWQGIEVLPPTKGAVGGEILMKNCPRVDDAHNAIKLNDRTLSSIYNNNFSKNYVDVYAENAYLYTFAASDNRHLGAVLKAPYKGQIISVKKSYAAYWFINSSKSGKPIVIGDFSTNGLAREFIENVDLGILANNTSVYTYSVSFKDIQGSSFFSPIGIGVASIATIPGIVLVVSGIGTGQKATLFDNCLAGVYGKNVRLYVSDNKMEKVSTGVYGDNTLGGFIQNNLINCSSGGIGISNTSYQHILDNEIHCINPTSYDSYGIWLEKSGSIKSAATIVERNTIDMINTTYGIRLSDAHNVQVLNNRDIFMQNARPNGFTDGINIINSMDCYIRGNNIVGGTPTNNTPNPLAKTETVGIFMQNSSSNTYCCNSLDKIYTAVEARNINDISDNFLTTTFGNHYYGLWLRKRSFFTNPIIGGQDFSGNTWNGVTAVGARNENGQFLQINNNQFLIETQVGLQPLSHPVIETPNVPQAIWFQTDNNGSSSICNNGPNGCFAQKPSGNIITNVDRLLLDDSSNSELSDLTRWTLTRNLYAKLEADPSLINKEEALAIFYEQTKNTAIANFVGIAEGIDYAKTYQTSAGHKIEKELIQKEKTLISINEKLQTAAEYDATLVKAQQDLYTEITTLFKAWALEQVQAEKEKTEMLYELQKRNESIKTELVYENNLQQVNKVILQQLLSPENTLDKEDIFMLENVAYQCDMEGGETVQTARAMLSWLDINKYSFDRENECKSGGVISKQQKNNNGDVKIYPNPAQDVLTIDKGTSNCTNIVIYNLTGTIVQLLNIEDQRLSFNTSHLQNGIYFCSFLGGSEEIVPIKFTIIH